MVNKLQAKVIFDAKVFDKVMSLVDDIADIKKLEGSKAQVKTMQMQHTLAARKGKMWRSTGEKILKDIFSDGKTHHIKELTAALIKEGYEKNSTSPRLSSLVKSGEVQMLGNGNYKMSKGR